MNAADQQRNRRVAAIVLAVMATGLGISFMSAQGPFSNFEIRRDVKAPPMGADSPVELSSFFPIGVFVQPSSEFAKWKHRGVNTVVVVPEGHDMEEWTAAANREGLRMIRSPRPDPGMDLGERGLLAWSQGDEPDLNRRSASELRATYERLKLIDPSRPVFVNFSGGWVLGLQGNCDGGCYREFIAASDWVSTDIYPVTGWDRPDNLPWVGHAIDRLAGWSGARPQFAFIETSDQDLDGVSRGNRGVTPEELRAQVWDAIIRGARGIWYFPVAFSPFRFDATPVAVAEEMTRQNATISALAEVLQGPINPRLLSAKVAEPLEVTWRSTPGGKYFIVLNLAKMPRTGERIKLARTGSPVRAEVYGEGRSVWVEQGVITDDFEPYGIHIYVVR